MLFKGGAGDLTALPTPLTCYACNGMLRIICYPGEHLEEILVFLCIGHLIFGTHFENIFIILKN